MEEKEKFNQSKYNYQWAQENYYRLTVLLPKNQKDKIKAHAAKCGDGSINAFVNRAIAETMERDAARLDAQQAAELEAETTTERYAHEDVMDDLRERIGKVKIHHV